MMNKTKLFIDNFLIYGVGGIISKIIPFVMLPIITRLMPDSLYYGLNDLANTIIAFASAIAVFGMNDALFRYFFERDDEEYKKDICSTALCFTTGMSIFVFFMIIIFRDRIAMGIFADPKYDYLVCLIGIATLIGATNVIVSAPTRMQNKRKIFVIMNLVSPIIGYSISIPMLLMGYYVTALPIAGIISAITIEMSFIVLNKNWFSLRRFQWQHLKMMLKIAVPLAPTLLIYWVLSSCDKIMIAQILGIDAAGVYAIGSKLGMASQLIYMAFAGGWQYFAFATMKDVNQVESNSRVMEYLGILSFCATMFICASSYFFYTTIFRGVYVEGYLVAAYLFLAPLLMMLYQVAANQFLIIKRTWPGFFILVIGAGVNVCGNSILIPVLGIEGAGLATLLGYVCSLIVISIVLKRMKLLVISYKFIYAILVLLFYMLMWRFFFRESMIIGGIGAVIGSIAIFAMYWPELKKIESR